MNDHAPSENDLNAYVDGELSPHEQARVAHAVAADPALAARVASLATLKSTVAGLADERPMTLEEGRQIVEHLLDCTKPVISAVNGYAMGLGATVAGILYAIWLRYTGPDTTLSFNIMVDILLMVVIGGMGTMYGSVLGATIFVLAQTYLRDLMKMASGALEVLPLLPALLHPDRWLLWLGVLFILCVYYFPTGIVGRLRR